MNWIAATSDPNEGLDSASGPRTRLDCRRSDLCNDYWHAARRFLCSAQGWWAALELATFQRDRRRHVHLQSRMAIRSLRVVPTESSTAMIATAHVFEKATSGPRDRPSGGAPPFLSRGTIGKAASGRRPMKRAQEYYPADQPFPDTGPGVRATFAAGRRRSPTRAARRFGSISRAARP